MFIYGDEKFYDRVDARQVTHYTNDPLEQALDSRRVFQELTTKYNVYLLHKPYGRGNQPSIDKAVKAHWAEAIGEQRIIEVPGKERAVDIAMAMVARSWGHYEDFQGNLEARQSDGDVRQSVYDAVDRISEEEEEVGFDPSTIIFGER